MKYKKSAKKVKTKLLAGFAVALTALFAGVPVVDTLAADTVASESSELEALRIKKEAAQAAYDAALADKLMAEDEVENARIALKDAQDNYEDVQRRYSTGFTGFLQWVIETEDDPVKAEDARRVLEEAFAGEQQISADDPANITRMLYMADWLEELAEHFRSNYGVEADTSHAAMRLAQAGFGEYHSENDLEKAYDKVAFENERISATQNEGVFKGFWYTYTHLANAQQEGMPLIEGLPKKVGDNSLYDYYGHMIRSDRGYDDGKYFNYVLEDGEDLSFCFSGHRFRESLGEEVGERDLNRWAYMANQGRYPLQWGQEQYRFVSENEKAEMREKRNIIFENTCLSYRFNFDCIFDFLLYVYNYSKGITIGYALGVNEPLSGFEEGDNNILGVVFNGKGTYTIAEYASALREYYSMTDPLAAKAYLSSKNDDLDNARRQLAGAEGLLATAYGTLKGAEKEYEEAAGYADVVSELQETPYSAAEAAPVSVVLATQYITGQSPVGAEAQEAQATQAATKAGGQEVMLSREETLEKSPGAEAQGARAPEGQAVTLSREDTFAETAQAAGGALQLPDSEYEHVRTDEAYEALQEDSVSVNEPALTASVMKEEPAAAGAPEKEAGLQSSSEKDKQKNGVLAEVLSYIFNGGAIAFIIPAGFRRKKKTGEMLQGEC